MKISGPQTRRYARGPIGCATKISTISRIHDATRVSCKLFIAADNLPNFPAARPSDLQL